jgi:gamma-glutamylputrescine oxidase
VHDPRSGHLHPLKYTLGWCAAAAAAGVQLHEHTPVTALRPGARAAAGDRHRHRHGRQVLLAGNVYLKGMAPALEPRIMPAGTYIACSEVLDPALADSLIPSRSAVCDTNFVLDYFRTTDDHRMLYGGRVSYSTATPANLPQSMRRRMVATFPQLQGGRSTYAWGGFVDISMNRAPDFGRHRRQRLLPAGLLGPWPGADRPGRSAGGRGDDRRRVALRRLSRGSSTAPSPAARGCACPSLVLGMAWYRLRDMLG